MYFRELYSKYILFSYSCSTTDPRGWPSVTAGSDHYFHTQCLSVRPHFSKSPTIKQFLSENSELLAELWVLLTGSLSLSVICPSVCVCRHLSISGETQHNFGASWIMGWQNGSLMTPVLLLLLLPVYHFEENKNLHHIKLAIAGKKWK